MERFESTIVVDAAPSVCYQKWHHFEQFPHFMNNVEDVRQIGEKQWHWVVNGPLGHRTEWDADVIQDVPNRALAWQSVTGSEVTISGEVSFNDIGNNCTKVDCLIQYDPPGGAIGEAVAHLFANPQKMVEEDLLNFKHLVEGTNVPAEKTHSGRHMEANPFVVPPTSENISAVSENAPQGSVASSLNESSLIALDEEEYELIYGLEEEIPAVGSSAEIDRSDLEELELLREEESPYLGLNDGAVYSEDLIDMRNDASYTNRFSTDIYSESMDIFDEDLASYTEDLDEEIDAGLASPSAYDPFEEKSNAGLGPRETMQSTESRERNTSLPGE